MHSSYSMLVIICCLITLFNNCGFSTTSLVSYGMGFKNRWQSKTAQKHSSRCKTLLNKISCILPNTQTRNKVSLLCKLETSLQLKFIAQLIFDKCICKISPWGFHILILSSNLHILYCPPYFFLTKQVLLFYLSLL